MKSLKILEITNFVYGSDNKKLFDGCESLEVVYLGCRPPTGLPDDAFKVNFHVINISLPDESCTANYIKSCTKENGKFYFKGGYLGEAPSDKNNTVLYIVIPIVVVLVASIVAVIIILVTKRKKDNNYKNLSSIDLV